MTYRQSSNLGVSYYRALKPIVDKKYDKSSFFFSSSSPRWNYTYKVRAGVQIERPGALRLVATFYQQQGFFSNFKHKVTEATGIACPILDHFR